MSSELLNVIGILAIIVGLIAGGIAVYQFFSGRQSYPIPPFAPGTSPPPQSPAPTPRSFLIFHPPGNPQASEVQL